MKGLIYMLESLALTKAFKSVIAFLLSVVMTFSSSGAVGKVGSENQTGNVRSGANFALSNGGETKAEADDEYPVVIVPGINHSVTYLCDENGNIKKNSKGEEIGGPLVYFDTDEIKKQLPDLIFPLFRMLLTQKDNGFTDKVYELCKKIFSVQATDENGNNINKIVTKKYNYPISQMTQEDKEWVYRMVPMQKLTAEIGEDSVYFFTFNLFGNIMDSARELDEYIQMVKKATGKDKVTLMNISLGGSVFTAYLDEYGYKDLHQVVNIVAALDGTDIVADLMARKFNLEDEYFYHKYLSMVAEENFGDIAYGYLLNVALRIIPKSVFQTTVTRVMDALLEDLMINCPQIWACVPSARYNEVAAEYFSGGVKAELKAKLDRYHEAQLNLRENVLNAVENGVRIDNICGADLCYGEKAYSFFNIVESAETVNSDGIVPLYSAGMGATGAAPGTTLDASGKYVNDKKTVDLSTSALPDNTWVFDYQHHEVGNNSVVLNLAKAIIVTPEKVRTNSYNEKYPMFNGSEDDKTLRRWRLPDAKNIDISSLSPEDAEELEAAIAQAEAALDKTVAAQSDIDAAQTRLENIMQKLGAFKPKKAESPIIPVLRKIAEYISRAMLRLYGSNGFTDGIKLFEKFRAIESAKTYQVS
ncbi:MAG: hypothetical protein ACI4GA_01625 [Acutalibacteraceae bacterium]